MQQSDHRFWGVMQEAAVVAAILQNVPSDRKTANQKNPTKQDGHCSEDALYHKYTFLRIFYDQHTYFNPNHDPCLNLTR